MILRYLLEKEFKQFFRNPFLPKLVVAFPILVMLVIPWIMTMDIKNIGLTVVNHDSGSAAEELIRKLESSSYFELDGVVQDYNMALTALEYSETDAIMIIPAGFEKQLLAEGGASVQVSINAVNDTKGTLGASYLSALCAEFSREFAAGNAQAMYAAVPNIEIVTQNRYNPYQDYKIFMIPALMVLVLLWLGGFLPALNIVGEKEKGTIEQINITPVSKFMFIFAKLIPYWVMGLLVLMVCMLLAWAVYGLVPQGSVWVIYLFSILFIFAVSGFGLIVSNYSDTMQQAMFVMFFFMLIFMLMSGLLTPLRSMPEWAQYFTVINPPRYYIEMMRLVYLKGGTLADLQTQLWALVAIDAVLGTWAVLSYRKRD